MEIKHMLGITHKEEIKEKLEKFELNNEKICRVQLGTMLIRKLTAVNASIVANKIVDKGFYRKLKTKQNKPISGIIKEKSKKPKVLQKNAYGRKLTNP